MTAHATHRAHRNSVSAFLGLDLSKREALVLSAFVLAQVPLTDRACMERLGFTDPNACRPRITELCEQGLLEEVGSTDCPITGKRVRICRPTQRVAVAWVMTRAEGHA